MAQTLIDPEFGAIALRRSHLARRVKLKIDGGGQLSISLPLGVPQFFARRLVNQSREFIRTHQATFTQTRALLKHGDLIGKSHRLHISPGEQYKARIVDTTLYVTVPHSQPIEANETQHFIKNAALKALRVQAKSYLGRRLQTIANTHGFYYSKLRFNNAGTRWGSCSSRQTISLNIWLMQLPFELIDYVLVHELCHTHHMNHSSDFWTLVEDILPDYRALRQTLKQQQPYL
ncbi:MAG TPA: SprT family zinc-dependent metalloprotease [Candidatus Saccharimonadales bacterium]|nr:SprT family zinc-dependent metalloprotease [Candidatus Saccharimonadales bacterium]